MLVDMVYLLLSRFYRDDYGDIADYSDSLLFLPFLGLLQAKVYFLLGAHAFRAGTCADRRTGGDCAGCCLSFQTLFHLSDKRLGFLHRGLQFLDGGPPYDVGGEEGVGLKDQLLEVLYGIGIGCLGAFELVAGGFELGFQGFDLLSW